MRRARALAVIVMAASTIIPAGMIHATPINRSTATSSTSADLTGIAAHPNGRGAWSVDRAGGVFTTGNARFFGSIPGLRAAGHAVGPS
ncbi:MAG TPA: hypothetical protein VM618_09565, partial [Acidimicrobiia bacterium]|nr:hypothetical protein [Acidimicrobiia bacterium]